MAKLKKMAVNRNIKKRAVSMLLAVAVLVSSIVFFGDRNMDQVEAEGSTKAYIEYIVDRMVVGLQENFNILEIVPYKGQGEFRYFVGDKEVEEGLESNQALLEDWYKKCGCYMQNGKWNVTDKWFKINTNFSNFGYELRYNSYTGKFEVRCPEVFLNNVVPYYAGILGERIHLDTVEANDLTAELIENADLIIISTGIHDNNTLECYKSFTQDTNPAFYDAYGNVINKENYDTYEKVVAEDGTVSYVSRDASWDMCQKLADYLIYGRNLELSDGTVKNIKTPVVLDNKHAGYLDKDGNMYKLGLILRMLSADRWTEMKNYLSTSYSIEGGDVNYVSSKGIVTAALDTSATGNFDASTPISWSPGGGNENHIIKFFNNLGKSGLSAYYDNQPFHADYLTDDVWVYNGNSALIPINANQISDMSGTPGFAERTGGQVSSEGILQYLLGAKESQIVRFNYTMKVLEVEPCNSFYYDTFEEVKALGEKMLMAGTESWTESNYRNYLDVECVTTNALNGMTTDLVSDYDMIIIGDNIELLTKDSNGKTMYNDRNLNGYIYLAFGDLYKMGVSLYGYLPTEYTEWNYSGNEGTYTNYFWNVKSAIVDSVSNTPRWDKYVYKKPLINSNSSQEMYNQMRYNELYKLNDANKAVFNDYIFSSDLLTHGNHVYVFKNPYDYYKYGGTFGEYYYSDQLYSKYSLGNTRLPDNDITDITKEKLIKYAAAGKLLVMCDSLYDLDGSVVYPTSDMFDFATTVMTAEKTEDSYDSIIRQSRVGAACLHRSNVTPEIVMREAPVELAYDSNGAVKTFCNRDDIKFTFDIKGQAGKSYRIKMLIDKNGDGVFKDVGSGIIDDRNEVYFDDTVTMPSSGVYSGYEIKTKLSDDFVGVLSWKIIVTQADDEVYSNSANGFSAVENDGEVKDIRVLQILPTRQYTQKNDGITLNLKTNELFKQKLNYVMEKVGYNIIIDTMYTYQYESLFNPSGGSDNSYRKGQDINTERDKLKSYDMVVIGFADTYDLDDISNMYGAVDNIVDFIGIGKAVLMTHDTITYVSTLNFAAVCNGGNQLLSLKTEAGRIDSSGEWIIADGNKNAVNLARELRLLAGMDKYGITLAEEDREGKEVPMYADSSVYTYGTEHGMDGKYYDSSNSYVRELQGFNIWTLYRTGFIQNFTYDYGGLSVLKPYTNDEYFTNGQICKTTKVAQLNEGQVTMYPYAIDEKLTVAPTHGQYYELDMEDEDIVVWYTLSDDGGAESGLYECTEKDGGNNYYIYSKNNITYSGAGHAVMDSEEELKLFVNTIVKAIAGGNNVPVVTVTNGAKGAGNMYNVYTSATGDASSYEIDIKATDADLITLEAASGNMDLVGEFKKAEVYWVKPDGTEQLIKTYDETNPLKNGIVTPLALGDTSLGESDLETIRAMVEDNIGEAKFRIYVEDWMGASDQILVRMVARDLFNLN